MTASPSERRISFAKPIELGRHADGGQRHCKFQILSKTYHSAVRTKTKKQINGAISIEKMGAFRGAFEGHSGAFGVK